MQLHELEEYLEDHVDREAQRLADGRHQNPVCMCSRSREVTLAVVPDRMKAWWQEVASTPSPFP